MVRKPTVPRACHSGTAVTAGKAQVDSLHPRGPCALLVPVGWQAGGQGQPCPAPQSSRCCSSQVDVGMAL